MNRGLVAGAIFGAGLISGGLLIQSGAWREADAATGSARLFDQVMARISQDYIDTLTTDDMYSRAAAGFVKEIDDPYSALLTPDRYRRLRESTSGRYAGVGIELDMRDGFVTVIAPLAGTPADSAGIRPGDRIAAVDGRSILGLTMDEVQQVLRGLSGTKVRLTLERGAEKLTLTLTRRTIVYHPVQRAEVLNGVGVVALATFSERAASELRRAIDSLRANGARSLILDLRENPGGLLEQGIAVADLFLNTGQTIASTRGRTPDTDHEFDDEAPQRWPGMPIVALVDSGTASAAEIVAGALQDNRRAVVIGSRTYGKGSAQSIFPVTGGRALKLTTARWFTPDGKTIERDSTTGGIEPDISVKREAGSGKRFTLTAPGLPASRFPLPANDPVVQRAMTLLAGVKTPEELRGRIPRRAIDRRP
ncbi:MAG TPA: S41 family peptidase [Gemmatimonadaceae bacterium]